jgi:hypothetical protein
VRTPSLNPPLSVLLAAKSIYYVRYSDDQEQVHVLKNPACGAENWRFMAVRKLEAQVRYLRHALASTKDAFPP